MVERGGSELFRLSLAFALDCLCLWEGRLWPVGSQFHNQKGGAPKDRGGCDWDSAGRRGRKLRAGAGIGWAVPGVSEALAGGVAEDAVGGRW